MGLDEITTALAETLDGVIDASGGDESVFDGAVRLALSPSQIGLVLANGTTWVIEIKPARIVVAD